MSGFSICALFYGDHSDLARRCLGSIEQALSFHAGLVRDFRLACNDCCDETRRLVQRFAEKAWTEHAIPSRLFFAGNVCKYPMMRRMFRASPLSDWVMWFDDDSYLEPMQSGEWWHQVAGQIASADMLGQIWLMPLQGSQWEWIKTQPWYNPSIGLPQKRARGRACFEFCQGAWWVIRSEVLSKYNWPIPELRHNGGDSLLGELFRHQGLRMVRFDQGVRINAGPTGRHSAAKRRGVSERHIGADYAGQPLPTGHQEFSCREIRVPESQPAVIHLFQPQRTDADSG